MNSNKTHKISEKLIQQGYGVKLTVGGISMFPYLLHKEQIKIIKTQPNDLHIGDIVVFKTQGKWIAHRLLAIHKTSYHIKGDFCIKSDPPIHFDNIVGKIAGVYRGNQFIDFNKPDRKKIHYLLAKISVILPPFVWLALKIYRLRKKL